MLQDASVLDVDQGQDEGSESEGAQSQGSWVGEFALSGGFVKTWLELSAESWESSRVAGVHVGEGVSTVVEAVSCAIDWGMILSCNVLVEPSVVSCCRCGGHCEYVGANCEVFCR